MIDPTLAAKLKTDDLIPALIQCLNQMHGAIQRLNDKLDQHIIQEGDLLTEAFPNADAEGHKRYHQAVIESMETRNKLIRECLVKAGSAGLLIGMGWLGYAAWAWFKLEVHR
jgi:hypothetical protein